MIERQVNDFSQWRDAARELLLHRIPPAAIQWNPPLQGSLFDDELPHHKSNAPLTVPKQFITLAETAACFRDNGTWALLYRILWRLQHEEKHLLSISTDNDIYQLNMMVKQVKRDAHKMKAFVRFREVAGVENTYVAWHEPMHLVVRRTAPFFVRRFAAMNWAILTPDLCVHWNKATLSFNEGVVRTQAPNHDDMEELWKTFYRNIFNPARIKVKMMKSEMPVKYWHTMPETALIPSMLEEADARVKKMLKDSNN